MVSIVKKEQETSSAMVRRFTQRVQASGVLRAAKEKKFFKKGTNRNMRRVAALAREKKRSERARLRRLGKIS